MRPPRWEYKTVKLDIPGFFGPNVKPDEIDATLNAFGHEGWELVSVLDISDTSGRSKAIVAMFKRTRD